MTPGIRPKINPSRLAHTSDSWRRWPAAASSPGSLFPPKKSSVATAPESTETRIHPPCMSLSLPPGDHQRTNICKSELRGLLETLRKDSYILWLFPYFWASNWLYTYEQNAYNLYVFNTRTRSFTGLWYWTSQIFGSLAFGAFLDNKRMPRGKRAIFGW
jgi:hypothetical protein